MSLLCTTERYDALYARWLTKPGELLDLGRYTPGERLLDFCGGTGVVSKEALKRGAPLRSVVLFDLNPRLHDPRVIEWTGDANDPYDLFCLYGKYAPFDIIVCRQALGYLKLGQFPPDPLPLAFEHLLHRGGRLVFNTFRKPRWAAKSYVHEGQRYYEASGYVGKRVLHIQAGSGLGADVSLFRWHTDEDIRRAFRNFHLTRIPDGRATRWVATRN